MYGASYIVRASSIFAAVVASMQITVSLSLQVCGVLISFWAVLVVTFAIESFQSLVLENIRLRSSEPTFLIILYLIFLTFTDVISEEAVIQQQLKFHYNQPLFY